MVGRAPIFVALTALLLLHWSTATVVDPCKEDKRQLVENGAVNVSACEQAPCQLKRKSVITVTLRIKPDKDIPSLKNNVQAVIASIPFPFLGVHNTDTCTDMYEEDGETKVSCPLKAGKIYVYKKQFPVLQVYPKLLLVVHYALTEPNTKEDVICFQLPSLITS